jgi:cytochrome c
MLRALFFVIEVATFSDFGFASGLPTKSDAVAVVKRIKEKYKSDGADATFKAVTDQSTQEFHDPNLQPFIIDTRGNLVAGSRPALLGKNLRFLRDVDGRYFILEMLSTAERAGSGWIEYKWPHPSSDKPELKSTYFEKMNDYLVGAGVYSN